MMSGKNRKPDEAFSPEEAARRRDEVIRRMANTPPQPRVKTPIRHPKTKKPTAADRTAPNPDADDKDA